MLGPSHLLFGATTYVAYSTLYAHQPLTQVVIGAVVATAVSDGVLSPDMDQRALFTATQEALGPASRPIGHRQVTHLWWLPVLAWWRWLPTLDSDTRWAATALLIGWASHILGDFVFGGRKKVPLLLPGWGPRVGLPLRTDGWVEEGHEKWTLGLSPLRVALTLALGYLLWIGVTSAV